MSYMTHWVRWKQNVMTTNLLIDIIKEKKTLYSEIKKYWKERDFKILKEKKIERN